MGKPQGTYTQWIRIVERANRAERRKEWHNKWGWLLWLLVGILIGGSWVYWLTTILE